MTESMVIVPEQAFKIRRHRNSKKNLTDVKVEMFQVVGDDVSSVKKLITIGELCHDNEDMMVPNAKYHELMSCVVQDGDHDDSLASGTKILYAGAEYISYPECNEQLPLLAHAHASEQKAKTAPVSAAKKEHKASPSTAKAKKGKAATVSTQAQEVKAAASTRVQKEKSATASATEPEEKIAADFNSATDADSASAQESSNVKVIIHSDLPETISKQVTENIKAKVKGDLIIKTASLTPDASRSSNGYSNPFFNSDMYEDEDDDDDIYVPEYLDDDDDDIYVPEYLDDDDDDMCVSSIFDDDDDDDDMYASSLFDDDDYDYDDDDDDDDDEFLDPESLGALMAQIRRENPDAFNLIEFIASQMRNHIESKAGMPAKDVINKLNEIQLVQDEPGCEWRLSMQPTDEHFAIFEKLGRSRKQVMDKLNNDLLKLNKKEKAKAKNAKPNRERRGKRRHK